MTTNKLIAQGKEFVVNPKFHDVSSYFKDSKDFGGGDDITLQTISAADVERVLKAVDVAGYYFKEVTRVTGNDPVVYIGEPLTNYLKTLSNSELNTTFQAAKQMRVRGLENHIAAFLAARVYIKLNLQEYNKKKQELGIKNELTPQRSKELKDKYAFLN